MSEFYEVEQPILNDAYEEPRAYWLIRKGEKPALVEGRRPARYFWRPGSFSGRGPDTRLEELENVNRIRKEIGRWRAEGYPGSTRITRELLDHWERPERERKIVFAQREAATAIIFLREADSRFKQGLSIPRDEPTPYQKAELGYQGLERFCVKMATGTGKTTVMGLLAAWSILNKLADPKNPLYSDTILVVCPNVTIRERLAELDPSRGEGSIYGANARDIVPRGRLQDLARGRLIITNWHVLQPHEGNTVGDVSAAVVNKGLESDRALVNRVLGPAATGRTNLLVFNDEAHHAYRIPPDSNVESIDLSAEAEEEERKEATVWIDGLEKIQKERRLTFVVDLSATPVVRYGPNAGKLFPWVVSDFGLVDAIESGLVKIPQFPVADTTGRDVPEFFNIWDWIVNEKLTAGERGGNRAAINPEAILRHAKLPIQQLAGKWRETFRIWAEEAKKGVRDSVPPVFIVVCRDTKLAKAIYAQLSATDTTHPPLVPEFANGLGSENTVRIDSKVAREIESGSQDSEARRLRFVLDTVGRTSWPGERVPDDWRALATELGRDPTAPPGRDVRCIVSVGMLTEGWDATTVTHIVGIRPFQSQLLCEQVVGRALRRSQWTDLTVEEVAQIFGVPFEIIPFKTTKPDVSGQKAESHHVFPRSDREHLAISFPRVEKFVPLLRGKIGVDWTRIPQLVLDPLQIPSETVLKGLAVDEKGLLTRSGPGKTTRITLEAARSELRLQALEFRLAARLTKELHQALELPQPEAFAQLLPIVKRYVREKVTPKTGFERVDLLLYEPWFDRAFDDLSQGIGGSSKEGVPLESPICDLSRPTGSTFDADFWTSRPVYETTKSHLNFAVADTKQWEQAAAYYLERNKAVVAYVKNFDLGFSIPYFFEGERHEYLPDYLIRVQHERQELGTLILEVKGYMDDRARATQAAAARWIAAVNQDGTYGVWDYRVCNDPSSIESIIETSVNHLVRLESVHQVMGQTEPRGLAQSGSQFT